jgi:hypothetical protein
VLGDDVCDGCGAFAVVNFGVSCFCSVCLGELDIIALL